MPNPRHVEIFEQLEPYRAQLAALAETLNPGSHEYQAVYEAYAAFDRARLLLVGTWDVVAADHFNPWR